MNRSGLLRDDSLDFAVYHGILESCLKIYHKHLLEGEELDILSNDIWCDFRLMPFEKKPIKDANHSPSEDLL
ncbi:MAG: hypothetical protein HWD61_12790 [Parachlamydiaceae bacterium]|nr:MAG: hypothetical protein HWD61_12790 [Parachlamydiaceae bacterium]